MTTDRFIQTIILNTKLGAQNRGEYLKKIFCEVGANVYYQPRRLPLYPELVKLHNNIMIASNVSFITHDAIHVVLSGIAARYNNYCFKEEIGCIEIMDNVFIGAGTGILYGSMIGTNVIVGAMSLVNKDLPSNGVYAGVPAKYICSFDSFVSKKMATGRSLIEKNQNLSEEEMHSAWELFYKKRNDKPLLKWPTCTRS